MENKSSKAVLAQAERDIQEEASTKSTLNSLNTAFSYRNVHECLAMVENPNQVTRSNIKCRLLVDVYPIQTVMLRTRQTKSDICTLCNMKQAEDRVHFILVCPALQTVRDKYLCRLQEVVPELKYLCVTKHEIVVQTLLDSSHPAVADYIVFKPHANRKVQSISRDFLYALHHERSRKINSARS